MKNYILLLSLFSCAAAPVTENRKPSSESAFTSYCTWRSSRFLVGSHPKFNDFDVIELCHSLSRKDLWKP